MKKESKVKFTDIKTIKDLWTRIEGDAENGFSMSTGNRWSYVSGWFSSVKKNENQALVHVSYCCKTGGVATLNRYVDHPTMN